MTDTAASDLRVLQRAAVSVRPLCGADLGFAAALHATALPHGFFARLGEGFLRAYLASFAASPHAVAVVAECAATPVGLLVGTVAHRAHYTWVVRHRGWQLAARGLVALAVRPDLLAFFLRTRVRRYLRGLLRLRRGADPHAATRPCPQVAVLSHVAVDPAARGAGAGAKLVEAFLGRAEAAGAGQACLVTLAGRDGAADFYRRLGWTYNGDRPDSDGRPVSVFTRRL